MIDENVSQCKKKYGRGRIAAVTALLCVAALLCHAFFYDWYRLVREEIEIRGAALTRVEWGYRGGTWEFVRDGDATESDKNGTKVFTEKYFRGAPVYPWAAYTAAGRKQLEISRDTEGGWRATVFGADGISATGGILEFDPDARISEPDGGVTNWTWRYVPDGRWVYFLDGAVESAGDYRAGKREGGWVRYRNGKIYEEAQYRDGVLNGRFVSRYGNGNLRFEGEYLDGARHGCWREYESDGVLSRVMHFKRGVEDGAVVWYNADGAEETTGAYLDGKAHGEWRIRYENGNPKSQGEFLNGIEHGPWIFYYEDGTKKEEGAFTDGNRHGAWNSWHDNGKPAATAEYVNGVKSGVWRTFNRDGEPQEDGTYRDGRKQGLWKLYYYDGLLREERRYADDVPEGEWKSYHRSGKEEETGVYKAGKKDGVWQAFFMGGERWRREEYVDGLMHGEWITWGGDGVEETRRTYDMGVAHGEWRRSAPSGNPSCIEIFHRGEKMKMTIFPDLEKKVRDMPKEYEWERDTHGSGRATARWFHPRGMVVMEERLNGEKKDGPVKIWHANGKLKMTGQYVDGKRNGEWLFYSASGELSSRRVFDMGREIAKAGDVGNDAETPPAEDGS